MGHFQNLQESGTNLKQSMQLSEYRQVIIYNEHTCKVGCLEASAGALVVRGPVGPEDDGHLVCLGGQGGRGSLVAAEPGPGETDLLRVPHLHPVVTLTLVVAVYPELISEDQLHLEAMRGLNNQR